MPALSPKKEKKTNIIVLILIGALVLLNALLLMAALRPQPIPVPPDMEERLMKYRRQRVASGPTKAGPPIEDLLPASGKPEARSGGQGPGTR